MAKAPSTKRLLIDKANSRVVIITSVAAFILVFSLVATKTLISQAGYQNHVISAKKTAVAQLRANIKATNTLKTAYAAFTNTTQNVLGGDPGGKGAQDGNNAQIVLDALPSSYDFPALSASLEKILASQNVTINSIAGTDDEVAQSSNTGSGTPSPIAMPFQISVTGDYQSIQNLIGQFEHSIRPFQIQTLSIAGDQNKLTVNIGAQTFYQPAKTLTIGKKVIQ